MQAWFLNAKNLTAAKIHWQLCCVYGPTVMSEGTVRQWVRQFKGGKEQMCTTKITVANHPSRMTTLSKKSTTKFMKISGSQFPRYQHVFHKFQVHFSCERWVSKMLTDEQKKQKISLNIPSAVQQPGGEIPRPHCDW
jgi:hypothetical protein